MAKAGVVDITFFQVSDTHYLVDNSANSVQHANVALLNSLPGTPYPGTTNVVGVPWGVIVSGDLIDAGSGGDATRWAQWTNFVTDFGLTGSDGVLHYPIYEGYGNHDQDTWLNTISNLISTRNLTRVGLVNKSQNGVHYSWNWGPVHFIMTNIRVGNGTVRYPPLDSLSFLQSDLASQVGDSGRPVIIIHHIPATDTATNEWPTADLVSYYQSVSNYNIIAILWGHTHAFGLGKWNGIQYNNCDNFTDSWMVFHITDTQLTAAQRFPNSWGTVANYTISMPVHPPRITSINYVGSSGVQLEVTGDNCLNYSVWASPDLSTWTSLYRTNPLLMPFRFTDTSAGAPDAPRRFYGVSAGQ